MNARPRTRSGCSRREEDHRSGGRREADEHRSADAGRVHHRAQVGGTFAGHVGDRVGRPVRATIAAVVPRDHAVTAREIRDLGLPDARVDDLPRRDEHHRRVARAVDLVRDPAAVALDDAVRCRGSAPATARGDAARPCAASRAYAAAPRSEPLTSPSRRPLVRSSPARRAAAAARRPCAAPSASAASTR